jgi:leucyl/phenylalanyl-tRNA---protein transferase
MALIYFPDPRDATEEGIVAFGGNLKPETLLTAYRRGIFPWPIEGLPLTWFCPEERAILEFSDLHIPRSLARVIRQHSFEFTIDKDFKSVITHCSKAKRKDQPGTWITPRMIKAYCDLHAIGHAHSVEVWEENILVGGLYGVDSGGAFAGESMFHLRPNASKLALLYLVDHLKSRGLDWLDIQVMTPHMEAIGAKTISRDDFLEKLSLSLSRGLKLFE